MLLLRISQVLDGKGVLLLFSDIYFPLVVDSRLDSHQYLLVHLLQSVELLPLFYGRNQKSQFLNLTIVIFGTGTPSHRFPFF